MFASLLRLIEQTPESIATALSVPERVLLFYAASGTDCQMARVTDATTWHMMVRNLIARDQPATRFVLTTGGCTVLGPLVGTG